MRPRVRKRQSRRTCAQLDYLLLADPRSNGWTRAALFLAANQRQSSLVQLRRPLWAAAVRDALLEEPGIATVEAGGCPFLILFGAYVRALGVPLAVPYGTSTGEVLLDEEVEELGPDVIGQLLWEVALKRADRPDLLVRV